MEEIGELYKEGKTITRNCKVCGKEFKSAEFTIGSMTFPAPSVCSNYCDDFYNKKQAEKRGRQRKI